ncbi:hypothetical protein SNEBB_004787 [Seison nebaliae]|nr:hypothetical protein SNEBB_004787 [Seison nebaliae]
MHGYSFVALTKNRFRRFFWLMLSLIGFGALSYFMYQYFNEFLNEKPTISSSKKIFLKSAKLPAITICNSQIIRKDKLAKLDDAQTILDFINKYQKQGSSEFASIQNEALDLLYNCCNKTKNAPSDYFIKLAFFEFTISACSKSSKDYIWKHDVAINHYYRSISSSYNFTSTIEEEIELTKCMEKNKNSEWKNRYNIHEIQQAGSFFNNSCLNDIAVLIGFTKAVDITDIFHVQKLQTLIFNLLNLYAIRYYGERKIAPLMLKTNLRRAIIETSWKFKDFIISCTIGDSPCNLDDFQEEVTSTGTCYRLETNMSQISPGNFGGLQLTLNIESYNQYSQNTVARGVNGLGIVIHHPTEPAAESLRPIALPTGTLSYITITNTTTLLLDESQGGNCNKSSRLDLYSDFTTFGCEYDCKYRTFEKLCDCMIWDDVRIKNSRDYWRKGCYSFQDALCVVANGGDWRLHADCEQCQKPSCTLYDYSPKVTNVKFMNASVENYIMNEEIKCLKKNGIHFNIPFNYLNWKAPLDDLRKLSLKCLTRFNWHDNIVKVNIFYDEISEIKIEQLPKYTMTDFIGCVGGTMGIYTGMSLITLFEVLEYLCFRILHI